MRKPAAGRADRDVEVDLLGSELRRRPLLGWHRSHEVQPHPLAGVGPRHLRGHIEALTTDGQQFAITATGAAPSARNFRRGWHVRSHQPPGRFSQEIVFPCDASDGPLGLGELLLERGLSGATFGLVGESQLHALDGPFALPGEGLLGDPELMAARTDPGNRGQLLSSRKCG